MSDHSLRVSLCAVNRVQLLPANKGSSWNTVRMKTGHPVRLFVTSLWLFFFFPALYEVPLRKRPVCKYRVRVEAALPVVVSVWKRYSVLFSFGEFAVTACGVIFTAKIYLHCALNRCFSCLSRVPFFSMYVLNYFLYFFCLIEVGCWGLFDRFWASGCF